MQERPHNINAADEESEATLVAPRFDAEEARQAHPVVPLDETRARPSYLNARMPSRRRPSRSWPIALIAVALLAVVAAGGVVATKVLRRPPAANAPSQTELSPAPAQATDSPQQQQQAEPSSSREEARTTQRSRTSRGTRGRNREEGSDAFVPAEILRGGEDFEGRDEEHHGRDKGGEKRRAREDDDAEKQMRKALKHVKGKVPRLVDVLTSH
ncbi:MAG: hypothetical protein QOE46_3071 [Acidobacteriota bacterium]|jgi:hypothetical protein|nr:hypothetical protein [Acidobacteriota bacterium]